MILTARLNQGGHLVVIGGWDTPEHQARFMEGRLGDALAEGGSTGPPAPRHVDRSRGASPLRE